MKTAKALCLDLASDPASSLASYWYARKLRDAGEKFWIMCRGGFVEDDTITLMPPSDANTDRVTFVGSPVQAATFTSHFSETDLTVDLFVMGVTHFSPIPSHEMLKMFGRVMALPETARWLQSAGIKDVEVLEPLVHEPKAFTRREPDERMHVALFNTSAPKLDFPASFYPIHPVTDGKMLEMSKVIALAWDADVLITPSQTLDDPVRKIFTDRGVPVVSPDSPHDLADRMINGARHRRLGLFTPIPEAEMPSFVPVKSGEYKLGIVVPFGGLEVDGLDAMLRHLMYVKPSEVIVVVSHQEVPGKTTEKELQTVEKLTNGLGIPSVKHTSPGGFRLGLARNQGFLDLPTDTTHVLFLDADTRLDPSYFEVLESEVRRRGPAVFVPHARNSNASVRVAAGVAAYPYDVFEKCGGFSDDFVGWGFEDLELLHRIRMHNGIHAVMLDAPSMPLVHHIDHEPRWVDTRDDNYALWQKLAGQAIA